MVQFFIKDSTRGVSPAGFDDIADGSLFAEFHILNDDVWEAVKDGTYKGFSLEGVFDFQPEPETASLRAAQEDAELEKAVKNELLSIIKQL